MIWDLNPQPAKGTLRQEFIKLLSSIYKTAIKCFCDIKKIFSKFTLVTAKLYFIVIQFLSNQPALMLAWCLLDSNK